MVVGDIVSERFPEAVIFLVDNRTSQKAPSEEVGKVFQVERTYSTEAQR